MFLFSKIKKQNCNIYNIDIFNSLNIQFSLFNKPRQSVEIYHTLEDFTWGKIQKHEINDVTNIYGDRSIYPLHNTILLEEPKRQDILRLHDNCNKLYQLSVL